MHFEGKSKERVSEAATITTTSPAVAVALPSCPPASASPGQFSASAFAASAPHRNRVQKEPSGLLLGHSHRAAAAAQVASEDSRLSISSRLLSIVLRENF